MPTCLFRSSPCPRQRDPAVVHGRAGASMAAKTCAGKWRRCPVRFPIWQGSGDALSAATGRAPRFHRLRRGRRAPRSWPVVVALGADTGYDLFCAAAC